jgi:hypothetical protein
MTPLVKPVRRKTQGEYRILFNQSRKIVVTLAPGDVLEFREAGRRAKFLLPIPRAFQYAVRLTADAERARKKAERKARKRHELG